MPALYTEVKIPKAQTVVAYQSRMMFVGSCFADNIGSMFANAKFNCLINPLGTLYNPLSIKILFDYLTSGKEIKESDFFQNNGKYSSYLMHGDFDNEDLSQAVVRAKDSLNNASKFLKTADVVFITLGTAFVYYLNENNQPVANCHKQNPKLFTRRMLTVQQSTEALQQICHIITEYNPKIRIVLTVSPIRHIADGATDNTLSKSTLLLSVNQTAQTFGNVEYFPSYEIMIDELRDYRFYESNLTHPSSTAREIIFERLLQTYCTQQAIGAVSQVENFMKSVNHKIVSPNSPETLTFAKNQIQKAMQLEAQNIGLNLEKEKQYFNEIINRNK